MVLTVAGSRRTRHAIVLRTALQDARATLYKARREDIEPGQPVEITLRTAPVFTGVVTAVQRDYRHVIIDARAAMLHTMATETVSAINGDSSQGVRDRPLRYSVWIHGSTVGPTSFCRAGVAATVA